MASIRRFARGFVCHSGSKLAIFDKTSDSEVVTRTEIQLEEVPRGGKESDKNKDEGNSAAPGEPGGVTSSIRNRALASIVSPSGKYFAVCDDQKQLHLFDVEDNWKLINRRIVPRRCTSLAFTRDEKHIAVADKTGDVYQCTVKDCDTGCKLILGHLSMLLDVVVTKDDQYIVTCDRDEKIRISHFPNCYNIHTYCLGHTEYVTSMVYIEDKELLISGGGDGQIILWTLQGKKLAEVDKSKGQRSSEDQGCEMSVKKLVYNKVLRLLAAIYFSNTAINLYHLDHLEQSGATLSHIQTVNSSEEPWDICFDDKDLWIIQPKAGEMKEIHGDDDARVANFTKSFNDSWEFFKESQGVDVLGLSQGLQKVRVDNMKEYLEKKQERINKQKEDLSTQGEPPVKIQKKDSTDS